MIHWRRIGLVLLGRSSWNVFGGETDGTTPGAATSRPRTSQPCTTRAPALGAIQLGCFRRPTRPVRPCTRSSNAASSIEPRLELPPSSGREAGVARDSTSRRSTRPFGSMALTGALAPLLKPSELLKQLERALGQARTNDQTDEPGTIETGGEPRACGYVVASCGAEIECHGCQQPTRHVGTRPAQHHGVTVITLKNLLRQRQALSV